MKKLMIFRFALLVLITLATGTAILLMRMGVININPHGLCPYSFVCFGIPTLKGFFTSNPFIIGSAIGLLILLLTPLTGRLFCGWLCPLGAIQEVLYRVTNPKKKGKIKAVISDKWHKRLKYLKYFILLMNIVFAYFLIQWIYMNACPVIAFANIGNFFIISAIILFIFVVGSVFIERFACRYLCPYGALMNILLKVSNFLKIPRVMLKINKEMCVNCELCSGNCPMQIAVDEKPKVIDSECILCQRCREKCPRKGIGCDFCNEREKNEKN